MKYFKLYLILILLLTQTNITAAAAGKRWFIDYKIIDVSELSPTQHEIKKALIRAFIEYNWEITDQSTDKLEGTYNNKYVIYAEIEGGTLKLKGAPIKASTREVTQSTKMKWKRWFTSIESRFSRELKYLSHARQADSY